MKMDINRIMECLPHRYPFLLVDRIEEIEETAEGIRVVGIKNVTYNEPFFQGHFPGEPVMPGVLVLEAMGQVSAVLLKALPDMAQDFEHTRVYLTSMDNVRFRRPVKPGDQLRTEAKLKKRRGSAAFFSFRSTVDGELVAEAEMGCVLGTDIAKDKGDEGK